MLRHKLPKLFFKMASIRKADVFRDRYLEENTGDSLLTHRDGPTFVLFLFWLLERDLPQPAALRHPSFRAPDAQASIVRLYLLAVDSNLIKLANHTIKAMVEDLDAYSGPSNKAVEMAYKLDVSLMRNMLIRELVLRTQKS